MAQRWSASRRSIDCGGGQRRPAVRVLHGRNRRRIVEDHRRRDDLEACHRRADSLLLGWRDRHLPIQSRHRLHRDGRVRDPREHHPGWRRLQDDGRRQDVGNDRPCRDAGHLEDPRAPDQPGSRVRRGVRTPRSAESRAGCLPLEGRRQDVGQDTLPRQQDRCD